MRSLLRRLSRFALWFAIVMVVYAAGVMATIFASARSADRIKAAYGHLAGRPASELVRAYRAPDEVERLSPIVYDAATGAVRRRLDSYIVYLYYPWPRIADLKPLRVIIDDKTETVISFKGPLD